MDLIDFKSSPKLVKSYFFHYAQAMQEVLVGMLASLVTSEIPVKPI